MPAELNTEIFHKLNDVAARYIAGGVISLNRKVDPDIIFKQSSISYAHEEEDIEKTLAVTRKIIRTL